MKTANKHIFIFSAGWRTGSTLIQRTITSGKEIFIWGELHELGDELISFYSSFQKGFKKWFQNNSFEDKIKNKYDNVEDANLNPDYTTVTEGMRAFFESVYFKQLETTGYTGWGWKTVRYGKALYELLKSVYPDAKMVFLVRDPYECIESVKYHGYMGIERFEVINVYIRLYQEFIEIIKQDKNVFPLKYEDFVNDPAVRKNFFDFCGITNVEFERLENTSKSPHILLSPEEVEYIERYFTHMEYFGYDSKYKYSVNSKWKFKWDVENSFISFIRKKNRLKKKMTGKK